MLSSIATVVFSVSVVAAAWPPWPPFAVSIQRLRGGECRTGDTRITEGNWSHDLFLSPRVSLADATLIIRALRRGDIENKQPFPTEGPRAGIAPPMPFIDAGQIRSISDEPGLARAFRLQTGCWSGNSYLVVIVNETLELRSTAFWIA